MRLSPVLDGLRHLPVRAPRRGQARAAGRAGSTSSTSASASRARRRRRSSARRWPRRDRADLDLPARPRACPSCARRSPAGSGAASARRWTPTPRSCPTLGSKEAIFHLAQVVGGDAVVGDRRPATRCPSAARGSPARAVRRAAAATPSAASCPTSTRSPAALGAWRSCGSTTPTTRPARRAPLELYERAAALAREHDFVLACDEAYSRAVLRGRRRRRRRSQLADRRNVARVQHALQALVDARLPLGLRRPATPS